MRAVFTALLGKGSRGRSARSAAIVVAAFAAAYPASGQDFGSRSNSGQDQWRKSDDNRRHDAHGSGMGGVFGPGAIVVSPSGRNNAQDIVEVTKCYPDFKSVKGVVACRSRTQAGAGCGSPDACMLYVDGSDTGKSTGIWSPPKSRYECECE